MLLPGRRGSVAAHEHEGGQAQQQEEEAQPAEPPGWCACRAARHGCWLAGDLFWVVGRKSRVR